MTKTLFLDISGEPAPQGSKKIMRGRLIEASGDKLKRWRKAISEACLRSSASWELTSSPVEVEVIFFLTRPKSVKPVKRFFPIVPPDLDKLCRGLLDGIGQSLVIYDDDSQVVRLIASKVYADTREAGAEVKITVM